MTRRAPDVTPMPREILEGNTPCTAPGLPLNTMTPPEHGAPEAVAAALKVCRHCPMQIKARCLAWAMDNPQVGGVYGGTTEKHRKAMRKGKRPRAANLAELALAA